MISQSLLKETQFSRRRWSWSSSPLLCADLFQDLAGAPATCSCKIGKNKMFQMSPSTLTSRQHTFSLIKCQFKDWVKGMLNWVWGYIYLGLIGHFYVFWWHFCLHLVIASWPNVGDNFQDIHTAHCAESHHTEARAVYHAIQVWSRHRTWMRGSWSWSVGPLSVSQTCKIASRGFSSH